MHTKGDSMKKLLSIFIITLLIISTFTVGVNSVEGKIGDNVVLKIDKGIYAVDTVYEPDRLGNSVFEISLSANPWEYNIDETSISVNGEKISRYTLYTERIFQPSYPHISYNYIFVAKPDDEIMVKSHASPITESTKNDCVNFYLDEGLRAEVKEEVNTEKNFSNYEVTIGYRYSDYELSDSSIVLGNGTIPEFKKSESVKSSYKNYTYSFSGKIDTVTVTGASIKKEISSDYPFRDIDAPKKIDGDYIYVIDDENNADLVKYIGNDKSPKIPKEIDGHKVKYLYNTFSNTNITEITVPNSVEVIGSKAFYDCIHLKNVTINEGVKLIKESAFGNTAITSVELPDSVEELGASIFEGLKLEKLKLGKNIKSVDYRAFDNSVVKTVCGYADTVAVMLAENNNAGHFESLGVTYTRNDAKKLPSEKLCEAVKNEIKRLGYTVFSEFITPEYLANSKLFTFYRDDLLHIQGSYFKNECDDIGTYRFTTEHPLYAGNDNQCGYYIFKDGELKSIMYAYYHNIIDINEIASLIPDTETIDTPKVPENPFPNESTAPATVSSTKKAFISHNKINLKAGKTASLKVIGGKAVSWKSSNKKIVSIKKGKVTALKKGTATVTARLKNGQKLKSKINVLNNPKLSKSKVKVKKNKTVSIKISGKASSVNNKYTKTKFAEVTSKKSANKIKIRGLKKGHTKLIITVNGKALAIKVKVI